MIEIFPEAGQPVYVAQTGNRWGACVSGASIPGG
jgi:hypothetical protein